MDKGPFGLNLLFLLWVAGIGSIRFWPGFVGSI